MSNRFVLDHLEALRREAKLTQTQLFGAPLLLGILAGGLALLGWGYFELYQFLSERIPQWQIVVYLVAGACAAVWAFWFLMILCLELLAMLVGFYVATYRSTLRSFDPDPKHIRLLKRLRDEEGKNSEPRLTNHE